MCSVGQYQRGTLAPTGCFLRKVPCRRKPQPPAGWNGQRESIARRQYSLLTYSSLVSPVVSRSCTSTRPDGGRHPRGQAVNGRGPMPRTPAQYTTPGSGTEAAPGAPRIALAGGPTRPIGAPGLPASGSYADCGLRPPASVPYAPKGGLLPGTDHSGRLCPCPFPTPSYRDPQDAGVPLRETRTGGSRSYARADTPPGSTTGI